MKKNIKIAYPIESELGSIFFLLHVNDIRVNRLEVLRVRIQQITSVYLRCLLKGQCYLNFLQKWIQPLLHLDDSFFKPRTSYYVSVQLGFYYDYVCFTYFEFYYRNFLLKKGQYLSRY